MRIAKLITAALLAATAMTGIPSTASAQDRDRHDQRGEDRGDDRGHGKHGDRKHDDARPDQRAGDPRRVENGADRGPQNHAPDRNADNRGGNRPQRPAGAPQYRGPDRNADRGGYRQLTPAEVKGRDIQHQSAAKAAQYQRDHGPGRGGDDHRYARDDRRDWRDGRNDDRTNWQGNRGHPDNRGGWRDNRGGWHDRARPGYADNRGWNGPRPDYRDWRGNRGGWSRDWRQDRRYDWRDYRGYNRGIYQLPRYYGERGDIYRRWTPGYRIDPYYYGQSYWISDPYRYRLPPAYDGYRWVRYYNDVMLVDVATGVISDVEYDFFY